MDAIRREMPSKNFSDMIAVLRKFVSFMNIAVSLYECDHVLMFSCPLNTYIQGKVSHLCLVSTALGYSIIKALDKIIVNLTAMHAWKQSLLLPARQYVITGNSLDSSHTALTFISN